jgi:hypothetical protein
MMQRLGLIAVMFHLWIWNSSAQTYTECKLPPTIYSTAQKAPRFGASLTAYFDQQLSGRLKNFEDTIQVVALIDSNGKSCCLRIEHNFTTFSSKKIRDVINGMPVWEPAKMNNRPVNYQLLIDLTCLDGKLLAETSSKRILVTHYRDHGTRKTVIFTEREVKPLEESTFLTPYNVRTDNSPLIKKDKKSGTVWKLWNRDNSRVPSNALRNVALDSAGVIWYCGQYGIVQMVSEDWKVYDGRNVYAIGGNKGNTRIYGLAIDSRNDVWAESDANVVEYDRNHWIKYDTSNSPLVGVTNICTDHFGNTWFCSSTGLTKYDGAHWTTFTTANSGILSNTVHEVYVDKNSILWIATDQGINKVENGVWHTLNIQITGFPDNDFTSIKGDAEGNVWAAGEMENSNCLIRINGENKIAVFPSPHIYNITIDEKEHKVWLATIGSGLLSFDGNAFKNYDKSNSIIPDNTVSDVLIDKNGDKWISTYGGLVYTNIK